MAQKTVKVVLNNFLVLGIIFGLIIKESEARVSTHYCGLWNHDKIESESNDIDTSAYEFPWQVLMELMFKDESPEVGWISHCGGVIINTRHVLTSASCLEVLAKARERGVKVSVSFLYGGHSRQTMMSEGSRVYAATSTDGSVEYYLYDTAFDSGASCDNDIAVVRLAAALPLYDGQGNDIRVNSICLPVPDSDPSAKATVSGWGPIGVTQDEELNDKMLKGRIPIIDRGKCNKLWKDAVLDDDNADGTIITQNMVCAVGDKSRTPVIDSGGPLIRYAQGRTRGVVIGIASFDNNPGNAKGVSLNVPTVFTRVSRFVSWIAEATQQSNKTESGSEE